MHTPSFERIALRDQVARQIVELIADGRLHPGDKVKEADISRITGVSRAPIREAFRVLENEGVVKYRLQKGIYVATFDVEDIQDVYDVRIMIDTFIAPRVVAGVTPQDIDKLQCAVQDMKNSRDHVTYSNANDRFHQTILSLGGSKRLTAIWNTIHHQVLLIMSNCVDVAEIYEMSLQMHTDIIGALLRRDEADYVKRIVTHHRVACQSAIGKWKGH